MLVPIVKRFSLLPLFAFTLLLLVANNASSQSAKDILGHWKSVEHPDKLVEIYVGKDALCYGREVSTPNKNMLKQLQYNEATKTFSGTMSPPDKDITLSVNISVLNHDTLKLVAKKFFVTKTMLFVRKK